MSSSDEQKATPRRGTFESVIQSVEQAVADILSEAEAESGRRIEAAEAAAERAAQEKEAEVARVAAVMQAHATKVRQRSNALLEALDEAVRELGDDSAGASHLEAVPDLDEQASGPEQEGTVAEGKASVSEKDKPVAEAGSGPSPSRRKTERFSPLAMDASLPSTNTPGPLPPGGNDERAPEHEALGSVRRRLAQLGRSPKRGAGPPTEPAAEDLPNPGGPKPSRPSASGGGDVSEGAVLLATQMAVAGGSREQIEARLRNDFGIADPGPILDGLSY